MLRADAPPAMEISLSRRLLTALLAPVLLLLMGGGLLAYQIGRMSDDAAWLDHSQSVLSTAFEARAQILDQETAIRGFLITRDDGFLAPYRSARPTEVLERLVSLTADNPAQLARAEVVTRTHAKWEASVAQILDHIEADIAPLASPEAMQARKARTDEVRAQMGALIDAEISLRAERAAAAQVSARSMRIGMLVVFVGLAASIAALSRNQIGAIVRTYGAALSSEHATRSKLEDQDWIGAGIIELTEAVQGELDVDEVIGRALRVIAARVNAEVGAAFVAVGEQWSFRTGHGFAPAESLSIPRGDGLLGRTAQQGAPVWLEHAPHDYLRVRSALGETQPVHVVGVPALSDRRVTALLELGFLGEVPERTREFLRRLGAPLGAAVRSAEFRTVLRDALDREQRQSEELQAQQEELRVTNEELEQQGTIVRSAHTQLEERQQALEEANAGLEAQTLELRRTEHELSAKAAELARASRYKSEFLANMSHELRTPLNSTLILAKLLADNQQGTLTAEQVRFAETIHNAGNDLLELVNDILDLSKIEAGQMEARPSRTHVFAVLEPVVRGFEPLAADKGLRLEFDCGDDRGVPLFTDVQRLQQIIKNLLSNAVKFTAAGHVGVRARVAAGRLRIDVSDTGIGFSREQAEVIFHAFRQADGTTSRKYGGTGLGLTISRDFARLLGGELTTQSEPGRGSTFHLDLPLAVSGGLPSTIAPRAPAPSPAPGASMPVPSESGVLLIIEDDIAFAGILADLARELGYQSAVAGTAALGLELANSLLPRAIILDIRLPDQSGLGVLDALKQRPSTRHIPVHVLSADDHVDHALALGAAGAAIKPVSRDELVRAVQRLESFAQPRRRRLLLVEDDALQRESVTKLLEGPDLEIVAVGSAAQALAALRASTFDCMVTDLGLPDASGLELLRTLDADESIAFPQVIVYTGRALSIDDQEHLRRLAPAIIVKGARSPERLLDEVSLFLHRVESELPPERQLMLRRAREQESRLTGRTVLIVEDDVRNIFALSSALEPEGCKVVIARNGREALERLGRERVDLVLMDIMMPEMDGLEATRRIRATPAIATVPIIALTAKAMPDDRDQCLAAGANDYITKPLQVDRLLSLVRVWIRPGAPT